MPIREWGQALNQFAIEFGKERVSFLWYSVIYTKYRIGSKYGATRVSQGDFPFNIEPALSKNGEINGLRVCYNIEY